MRVFLKVFWLAPAALLAVQPALAAKSKAKAPAPLVQNYAPRPGLWLLADEDTKIYLLGTTHMLAPGFKWRSRAVDKAVAEADELVVETYEPPGSDPDVAYLRAVLLDKPRPVLERVPPEHRAALAATLKRHDMGLENAALLRTWMLAVMLGYAQDLEGWGVDDMEDAPGVEDWLEKRFRKAKKPISGVEGPEAGLDAFNALPEEKQVELLIETILPAAEDEAEEAETPSGSDHLWAQGRYEEAYARDMADFPPELFDGLVVKRNAAWTRWLKQRLDRPGTVLFAVGAAHLAGPQSVQTMLAASGLQTKRVD
jgi:uncharacterized protein YbaP (TraB family)